MSSESNFNGKTRMNICMSNDSKEKLLFLADKNVRSASQQAEYQIALSFKYAHLINEMELKAVLASKEI